jgi:hypothetical protein
MTSTWPQQNDDKYDPWAPWHPWKKSLKEEIINELIEIFREKLQETVKEMVQGELKQYQDTTNKKNWKDTETTKWTQRGLDKFKSKTKETINKEIYEMKIVQDMKEEFNKDMENSEKRIKQKSWK